MTEYDSDNILSQVLDLYEQYAEEQENDNVFLTQNKFTCIEKETESEDEIVPDEIPDTLGMHPTKAGDEMDTRFGSVTGSTFEVPLTKENVMPLVPSSKYMDTPVMDTTGADMGISFGSVTDSRYKVPLTKENVMPLVPSSKYMDTPVMDTTGADMGISFGSVTGSRYNVPLTKENVMPLIPSSKYMDTPVMDTTGADMSIGFGSVTDSRYKVPLTKENVMPLVPSSKYMDTPVMDTIGADMGIGLGSGSRFAVPLTEENIMPLLQSSKSSNSEAKIRWAINLFREWQKERRRTGYIEELEKDILEMTNEELNSVLSFFVAEVRKVNGEEYRGNTLYEIIVGIQAFLREKNRMVHLLSDDVFKRMRDVLDATMKNLAKRGVGMDIKKAGVISHDQEETLWRKNFLGCDEPTKLVHTLVYLIGLNFALRAGQEHRSLRFGPSSQFQLGCDNDGVEYLSYTEDFSKTNTGGLNHRKLHNKAVKIHQNENKQRCLVDLYKIYVSHRPQNNKCDAFYLRPLRNPKGMVWYGDSPIGKNELQTVVGKLCASAGFTGFYSNHSLRATAATRLYQAGVDEQLIAERTGHRSNAVRSYKRSSEDQIKEVTDIISRKKTKTDEMSTTEIETSANTIDIEKNGMKVKITF